jgi:hypothetical protein
MNGPFDRKRLPASPEPRRDATQPVARPPTSSVSRSEEDEARSSSKYRAALEALFTAKQAPAPVEPPAVDRPSKKMITLPTREDPRGPEREKRLAKLLAAEGRAAVTKAAEDFAGAGFDFPQEQEVFLKLLDHGHDERVRAALDGLTRLLGDEAPQRRTVLEARLRRLEDDADDADVRDLAGSLRRRLLARPGR